MGWRRSWSFRPGNDGRTVDRHEEAIMKIHPLFKLLAVVIGLGSGSAHSATSYRFTFPNFPGASVTIPAGINDQGEITGSYAVPPARPYVGSNAYLWSNGVFHTIDRPGAKLTQPYGINNQGEVVGDYFIGEGHDNFVRSPNGTYSDFDLTPVTGGFPGTGTLVASNTKGWKVGIFDEKGFENGGSFLWRPFPLPNGTFTTIGGTFPLNGTPLPLVSDINDNGVVAGSFGNRGFITSLPARLEDFTPVLYPGALATQINGIDDKGDVVGTFQANDPKNSIRGFIRTARGAFSELNFPNGYSFDNGAGPADINDDGVIVGAVRDAAGNLRGFEAFPIPEPRLGIFLSIGLAMLGVAAMQSRRLRSVARTIATVI
jgi:hypothetical protein